MGGYTHLYVLDNIIISVEPYIKTVLYLIFD